MTLIAFRTNEINLTSLEVKSIIEKGSKLFELMDLTDDAEVYLKYNPELKEVIKKW
jgi:hypothetical protein